MGEAIHVKSAVVVGRTAQAEVNVKARPKDMPL